MQVKTKQTIAVIKAGTTSFNEETEILQASGFTVIKLADTSKLAALSTPVPVIDLVIIGLNEGIQPPTSKFLMNIYRTFDCPVMFIGSTINLDISNEWEKLEADGFIESGCSAGILLASVRTAMRRYHHSKRTLDEAVISTDSVESVHGIGDLIQAAVLLHPLKDDGVANFVSINQWALERYGYTEEEFLKLKVDDISAASSGERKNIIGTFPDFHEAGRMVFETTHITKEGVEFPAKVYSTIIKVQGKPMILCVVHDLTGVKQQEQKMEEGETQFRELADMLPEVIFETDREMKLRYYNHKAADLFGLSEADLYIGINVLDMIVPDDRQRAKITISHVIKGKDIGIREYEGLRLDGSTFPILLNMIPKYAVDKLDGFRGIIIDASERKQLENDLRAAKLYSENLMATANTLIVTLDKKATITSFNKYAEQLTGYKKAEVIGKNWFKLFIKSDDQITIPKVFDDVLKQMPEVSENENAILTRDGRERYLHWNNNVIHAADGSIVGLLSIGNDITERENAIKALVESEKRYRTFFENTDAIIMMINPLNGNIIFANKAAIKFYGYSKVELIGMHISKIDVLPPEEIRDRMRKAKENQQNYFLFKHRLADASIRDVEIYQSILVLEGQEVFSIIVHDITDRLIAEESRKSLERQVQHAQKLESLGVLAGGIAHDFNNILTSILGNADLALSELSPLSPARDNLVEIENASRRAADLAKQMLAYSGKGRFVVEPIRVGELVAEMAHMLEVSISKKAVLKYNFAENLPTFNGDTTQMRQIIMNLITNASDAIGDKSGIIALSTGAMDCDRAYLDGGNDVLKAAQEEPLDEGVYVYIEVSDTGCGMDDTVKSKIFDPFFTTKFTGRGLGMAAVLGIVRGHRGAIKIYSELEKGTTFKILFPASDPPDPSTELRLRNQQDAEKWQGHGTIIIVDDEESVRAVGKRMLEKYGFTVKTARDGIEGLKVYQEMGESVVCVLLDLTMPHMDGEQTFRELRRINPNVKVILCSGYNEQDATQNFSGKGLAGFLKKPYTLSKLREKLQESLGK